MCSREAVKDEKQPGKNIHKEPVLAITASAQNTPAHNLTQTCLLAEIQD